MAINQEIVSTLEVIKALYNGGDQSADLTKAPNPSWSGGPSGAGFGLGLIASPSGYPSGVYGGFTPYNLEPGARLLAPVITPIRNRIPRTKGKGTAIEFRAVTNYNSGLAQSWATEGVSGPTLQTGTVKVVFPYKIQSLYNQVSFEAQYYGQGQVDAMALATANALRAFMVAEDNNMLFGNPFTGYTGGSAGGSTVTIGGAFNGAASTTALTALSASSVVGAVSGASNALTGSAFTGTIAAGTYWFLYTALSGPGQESLATGVQLIAAATPVVGDCFTVTLGSAGYVVFQPPVIPGAISYNLYWKLSSDTNWSTVQGVNGRVVLSSYTTGSINPTTGIIPNKNNTNPATSAAWVDGSANTAAYAGIFPQLMASGSGASVLNLQRPLNMANNAFTDIDNLLLQIWNNGQGDPEALFLNAFESLSITTGTLGAGTPYFIKPDGQQNSATANFRVSRLTNKVTGSEIEVITHPRIPQGTVLALSTRLPSWYPGSDIGAVWEFNTPVDYQQLAYAVTGPYFPFEIRNWGAVLCYLPLVSGVLTGVSKA